MNIKVTSDSTCDLSPELISAKQIGIVPLTVIRAGAPYLDGVSIQPQDIFRHVDNGGAICTTAAPAPEEYTAFFSRLSPGFDAVVHISIGSGFSVSHQNALKAAERFPNVFVIDSQNLSTGQGLVVMEASRLANDCADVDGMLRALRDFTRRVDASFLMDRLDYMRKGGRCSAVAALGANLMRLKIAIEVKDGHMRVYKKYRGSYDRCLREYIQERLHGQSGMLFITHTPVGEAIDAAREAVREAGGPFGPVYETQAGCTVSCHCGPGTLGVLFVRAE